MGLINRIFGSQKSHEGKTYYQVKGINNFDSKFSDWNGNMYEIDIAKSAIHSVASNGAKLNPKHQRKSNGKLLEFPDVRIKKMLEYPNPYMNIYDFLYKVITHREEKNNAFIYFNRERYELYPIAASNMELLETEDNRLFVRFTFRRGQKVVIPFQDLIIIRKHFNNNDLFGDNDKALHSTMDVINTVDQGIVKAVKRSANLRGLLKFKNILKEEDVTAQTNKFVENYLNIDNDGGVAAVDPRFDFEQIKNENYVPNKLQMDSCKERIYSYFGTNEKIIQSKFTEEEWNAFYENTLEPIALQLSLEFSKKLFSDREVGHGNLITFEANRLQYASNSTKVAVARLLTDIGAASLDQILEIFNMAPIGGEEGSRRVQTLNMVNANKADEYQVGKGGEDDNTEED